MNGNASPVPARLVLATIAGVWLCYFLLVSLRGAVVGLELTTAMLSRRLVVTIAAMAITGLLWPLLRLLDHKSLWLKAALVLAAALPASLAIATINQWVFSDIESQVFSKIGEREGISIRRDEAGNVLVDIPDERQAPTNAQATVAIDSGIADENRWRQVTDQALGRYFILLAWAALYLALANAQAARSAERREGEYRRAAKAAELLSLRYQVNPHFLFNTLNSLSALVMTGKTAAAEEMIQTLSTFYRRSLSPDPTGDVSLAEEIALQKLYLDIEAVRFPDRLRINIAVPDALCSAQVPGMILQPLIENSVKYGVAPSRQPVTLRIAARKDGEMLELIVSDDGKAKIKTESGCGIGLTNVRDRLAARFGEAAHLVTGPVGGGYRTVIRLPLVQNHG